MFEPSSLVSLPKYPGGRNYVVSQDTRQKYTRSIRSIQVEFASLRELLEELGGPEKRYTRIGRRHSPCRRRSRGMLIAGPP